MARKTTAKVADFLDRDGYLNVPAIVEVSNEMKKFYDGLGTVAKLEGIHFVKKALPKYDAAKAKSMPLWDQKRAQVVGFKSRPPKDGARVRMVVVLRSYKPLKELNERVVNKMTDDEYNTYEENMNRDEQFQATVEVIKAAMEQHNAKAEKFVEQLKAKRTKDKEVKNKAFDNVIDVVTDLLVAAGLSEDDIAVGVSMMGKTLLARLPKKAGFISIGMADAERFKKAVESDGEPPVSPLAKARASKSNAAPVKTTRGGSTSKAAPASAKTSARSSGRDKPVATVKRPGRR